MSGCRPTALYGYSTVLGGYGCRIFELLLSSDYSLRDNAMSMEDSVGERFGVACWPNVLC